MSGELVPLADDTIDAPGFTQWKRLLEQHSAPSRPTAAFLAGLSEIDRDRYEDERRTAHANIPVIVTPQYAELRAWLLGRLRKNGRMTVGKRACFIIGEPFQGKSASVARVLQQFEIDDVRKYGSDTCRGVRRLTAVSVSMWRNDNPGAKNIAVAIASFYGVPDPLKKTTLALLEEIRKATLRHETMVIFIDELHYFGRSPKVREELTAFFKSIMDHLHVTLVLVGIGIDVLIEHDTRGVSTRSQLSLRSYPPFRLGGFDISSHAGRAGYLSFIGALSKKLLLAEQPSNQLRDQWAVWLLGRSGGRTGLIVEIVVEAADAAIVDGREYLLFRDLAEVNIPRDVQRTRVADLEHETTRVQLAAWLRTGQAPVSPRSHR
jgi:hypothetical protein